jgi:hypothetical protein
MHFIHDEDTDLVLVADAGPRPASRRRRRTS